MFLSIFSFVFLSIFSAKHSGFLVAVEGDVKVLRSTKQAEIPKNAINVKTDGKMYKLFKAKVYGKIYENDTIVTGKDSKSKIVLSNANTLMIGPYTNFSVKDASVKKNNSSFKLLYGKIRSVVKQDVGKNGEFKIQTPSSVIGVRGTDFYTIYRPQNGTTTVTTLNGVVAVQNLTGKIKKEVLVEAGYTSHVIDLEKLDLKKIKKTIKTKDVDKIALPTTPKKANSLMLSDIKEVSTMSIDTYNENEIDTESKLEALKSQNQALELIKEDETKSFDTSNDLFNMNLDNLIKKVRKEEETRQKDYDQGALNRLEQWMMSY